MADYTSLILAAGSSSRMGTSKQLLRIGDETLLHYTVRQSVQSRASRTWVVLGCDAENHRVAINDMPVEYVVNNDWASGMGNSLKAGIAAINALSKRPTNLIVTVCDQPFLTTDHLNKLISAGSSPDHPLVASEYDQIIGVPAVFHHTLFDELLSLDDSQGARALIIKYANRVQTIPFPGGGFDLDTPDDVRRFIERDSHK